MNTDILFLYGPPGSGKTSLGQALSAKLGLPFIDLDGYIEKQTGRVIYELFETDGEDSFRSLERQALRQVISYQTGVIALGGGTLLDHENRQLVDQVGQVLCLAASPETLEARMKSEEGKRPLLQGNLKLRLLELLSVRSEHYASFINIMSTDQESLEEMVHQSQMKMGMFHLSAMGAGSDVRIAEGCIEDLGRALRCRGLKGPVFLVSDENLAQLYTDDVLEILSGAGYAAASITLPAGEQHKTVGSLQRLWSAFLSAGVERASTVVALGGGVITDLAGFAAATYMRGVSWVCVPTSVIGMVDASLGGKTGVDLPQGKNLVGAFYPPRLVFVDPRLLTSLPEVEQRNGLAEVVKHGLIADPGLFKLCQDGLEGLQTSWEKVVRRAVAVKINLIESDPYDRGARNALNLGHTLGHAIEQASGYQLKHGEAVAIGMVFATRLSTAIGLASQNLVVDVRDSLSQLGLPVDIPHDLDTDSLIEAMRHDKKRQDGKFLFVLLAEPGDVRLNQEVDEDLLRKTLEEQ